MRSVTLEKEEYRILLYQLEEFVELVSLSLSCSIFIIIGFYNNGFRTAVESVWSFTIKNKGKGLLKNNFKSNMS